MGTILVNSIFDIVKHRMGLRMDNNRWNIGMEESAFYRISSDAAS